MSEAISSQNTEKGGHTGIQMQAAVKAGEEEMEEEHHK